MDQKNLGNPEKYFQRLALIINSFIILFGFINYNDGARFTGLSMLISVVFFYPLTYLFQKLELFTYSKLSLVFLSNTQIVVTFLGMQQPTNVEYYFFVSVMTPLLLFTLKERKFTIFSVIIGPLSWGILQFITPLKLSEYWVPSNFPFSRYRIINFYGTCLILLLIMRNYLINLKNLNDQVKKERDQRYQSASLISLGEMAGGIAHEINNPLAIIQGTAEQLIIKAKEGKSNPETFEKKLQYITRNASRIGFIVKNLILLTRSYKHKNFELVSIKELIERVLSLCINKLNNAGISYEMSTLPEVSLNCYPAKIQQAIMSLINNSYEAVISLEVKWIRLEISTTKKAIEIRVTDSGPGIPSEIVPKIMQPFYTTKEIGKNMGLGLSTANGIINEHKGTLHCDSEVPNTSFVITLPYYDPSSNTDS